MWERVVGLRGKTLETLGRPRPFTIVEVTQNGLEVRVSTGNVRYIPRPNVESSWAQLLRNKELTLDDIRENHTKANPAYVAAVLAEMPGVTKKTGPIRLSLRG